MKTALIDKLSNHAITAGAALAWLIVAAAMTGLVLGEPGALVGVVGGIVMASFATAGAVLFRRRLRQIEAYELRVRRQRGNEKLARIIEDEDLPY